MMKTTTLFLCLSVCVGCSSDSSSYRYTTPAEEKKPDEERVWDYTKSLIENRLKSPSTASYGDQTAHQCVRRTYKSPKKDEKFKFSHSKEKDAEKIYFVHGWVDSQNSFGATIRSKFMVELKLVGEDDFEIVTPLVLLQR